MNVVYDISIIPLLHISLIVLLLAIFSVNIYLKTNIKTDLYLAICFGLIFILPLSIYSANGYERIRFWSSPYHIAALTVLLTMLVVHWLVEKRSLQECLPLILLTGIIGFAIIIPSIISVFICAAAFIFYAIWLFYRSKNNGEFVRIIFFIAMGICIAIGQIALSKPFIFLYSLTLLSLLVYESLRYLNRVVLLMKNAGINSITDPLTGLFNRGYLLKKSEQLIKRNGLLNVIFIDIDDFKQLNDTRGHDYGDFILIQVSTILRDLLKDKGYACRFGGEEMVGLILTGDMKSLKKIAENFRERVKQKVGVTVSVGIASSIELASEPDEDLHLRTIKKADERMYFAKINGKNRVVSEDV